MHRSTRRMLTVGMAALALSLASCRTAPIQNISGAPVPAGKTAQQVGDAIVAAGNSLGWQMKPAGPGRMTGTLLLRDHQAVVDIAYSAAAYSITYKDSSNLKYDGTTIHSNYNGWIQNLDKAIRVRL